MKQVSILAIFAFMMLSLAFGQNAKVTTGIMDHDQGNHESAVANIEEGISDPSLIKPKRLVKAYVYLSESYMQLGNSNDPAIREKYPYALIKSYNYIQKGKELDATQGNKYDAKIKTIEVLLGTSLYNGGAVSYNEKNYETAQQQFEKAVALSPEDYRPALMLGYSTWMMKDTAAAMDAWELSIANYKKEELAEPDNNIASAYLLLSSTYADYKDDVQKALEVISEGRQTFPLNEDLQLTELGLYQTHPELFEDSKAKFEEALKTKPDDKTIKLAYAALLAQNNDEERAMQLYNEVLALDPEDFQANLNIGAQYINDAAVISKKMMDSNTKDSEIDELEKKIIEKLEAAYPYMLKCHEKQPDNIEWVNQLANITLYVPSLMGESSKWIEKQKELKGN